MVNVTLSQILIGCGLITLVGCLPTDNEPTTQTPINCDTATAHDDRILCAHNQVRADVTNPTPVPGLEPLVWNEDLANVAQSYAEQCIWAHNADRGDTFNVYIGENLYASTNEPNPETAVTSWADEVSDYNFANNSCTAGAMCGH